MKEAIKKALRESAKLWWKRAKMKPEDIEISADNCPLCVAVRPEGCDACPVYEDAGTGCGYTVVGVAQEILENVSIVRNGKVRKVLLELWPIACNAVAKQLLLLIPKERRKK